MVFRFPDRVRQTVLLGVLDGRSYQSVADEFAMASTSVWRIRHDPVVMVQVYASTGCRLGLANREEISRGLACGRSFGAIAKAVGCAVSTVSREVARNGGCQGYRAAAAQAATCERARRPKRSVFDSNRVLAVTVESWLEYEQWSPEQISAKLIVEFPDDESMRVSPETIYQALYVYGRGGLRKELTKHLRTQRPTRRPRTVTARNRAGHPITEMVMIVDRPEEVAERLVPGHWEGDLILGRNGGSQVATLVERTTGLVMLGKLDNKQAPTVAARLQERIETLPKHLRRSLTWDQGTEMAAHASLTIATGVPVYFCDPHAPWQRGSNENINGLLRQYLPHGTDLSRHSQDDLDLIADKLNRRPRKRHGFLSPSEKFNQLLLH